MMVAVMALFAMSANAQKTLHEEGSFTLQPKFGLALGAFSGSFSGSNHTDSKLRVGLLGGVEGEYYVNGWFSGAFGLNYAQQGWKETSDIGDATVKLDYLNIPLTANFYVAKGFALKAGLQFGFLMSAKRDDANVKDAYKTMNISIPVGLSYEISDFVIDARCNFSVTRANKKDESLGIPFFGHSERSDLIQITLGYKFEL